MICPRCKTEVKDGTSYCPSCGEDLRNIASGKGEETVKEDADSAEKVGTGSNEAEENKASESNEGKEGNESVCPKCGKRVNPGEAFCSSCGAVLSNKAPDFSVNEGEPVKPGNTSAKLLAVLAYLGILVLIPILVAKEDKFVRFHANQGGGIVYNRDNIFDNRMGAFAYTHTRMDSIHCRLYRDHSTDDNGNSKRGQRRHKTIAVNRQV